LRDSFKAVKRNPGAAGIDTVSIRMVEANLEENLQALRPELKQGLFQPCPLRRAFIPKKETEFRPLGIPAVKDRVAQEGVRRLLSPILEPLFQDASYGFRPGRNCHQAFEEALRLHREGFEFVLEADIQGFLDNLSHRIIMTAVAAEVAEGNILRLVERFLASGVIENGVRRPTHIGTPPGGVISPWLANIVLNHLDWQLEKAGLRCVRYADDFVVLCPSRRQAEEALARVTQILENGLGLPLSPEKTNVTSYGKGDAFLGFHRSRRSRRMRPKSVKNFKDTIRKLTCRSHNVDGAVMKRLNRVIRGTAQYFATGFFTAREAFHKLDSWIRMRLRCMQTQRKCLEDNRKIRVKAFRRLGLLTLESFCDAALSKRATGLPSRGNLLGVARCVKDARR
jgi:group II intron reverse transcriptase/maturase